MTSLWERIQDWVILAVMLIASLAVMFTRNEPLTRSVRALSLEATSRVESQFAWVGTYFRALKENSRMREDNIQLSSEVARSREARAENARLRRMLSLRDTSDLELVAARIVAKDVGQERNLFTINAGIKDSVDVGMAVIDERGILGKVVLVSTHYARIMPYLNTDFRVPAKIRPLEAEGLIRWEGSDPTLLVMEHVPRTEQVLRGQLVVTSGYSGVFPEGLSVGYVDSVAVRPGRNEYRIFVQPSSPLRSAENVFVVLSLPDPEMVALNEEEIR